MKKLVCLLAICLIAAACKQQDIHDSHESTTMDHETDSSATVMLNAHQQYVANVTLDTVRFKEISETVTMLGSTAIDQNNVGVISSRVGGRIDELLVRSTGEYIKKGTPLYSIYSEELIVAQREYVNAIQLADASPLANLPTLSSAARRKLVLLGMQDDQILSLESSGNVLTHVTFYSSYSGIVSALDVSEGQYVEPGTSMFTISDLEKFWVETQVYSSEISSLGTAENVQVEFPYVSDQLYDASIVFHNPLVNSETKINLVRLRVNGIPANIAMGEMAYVHVSKGSKKAVVVPRSAIVYETRPAVWISLQPGVFEKRMVKLGIQNKKEVEVIQGLTPGNVIAVTGSYLINSEYVLQKGAGSMGGMKM